MKILAFSDLHLARARAVDLVAASAKADLVIGAGDFCNMRQGLDTAIDLLTGITVPFLAVPGNAESAEELKVAAPSNMQVLHGKGIEIGGITFFGLGGAVPETPFGDWSYDLSEMQAQTLLNRCEATDVLILHSPPKGIADISSTGASLGSVAIRTAIERLQPQLALCGHIHDSWGQTGTIGETHVMNLGPLPRWFEIEGQ